MNLFQMMMARRMQRNQYGGTQGGAVASGCGCLGSIFALVVVAASLFAGYKVYEASMDTVDASLEQADRLVDESLDEFRSGDLTGIGYEGTYECEATSGGAVATLEITNTEPGPQTYDVTWSLFAVPVDTDVNDLMDFDPLGDGDLLENISDNFTLQAGESATKTYEAPEMSDDNIGCGPPIVLTGLPAS